MCLIINALSASVPYAALKQGSKRCHGSVKHIRIPISIYNDTFPPALEFHIIYSRYDAWAIKANPTSCSCSLYNFIYLPLSSPSWRPSSSVWHFIFASAVDRYYPSEHMADLFWFYSRWCWSSSPRLDHQEPRPFLCPHERRRRRCVRKVSLRKSNSDPRSLPKPQTSCLPLGFTPIHDFRVRRRRLQRPRCDRPDANRQMDSGRIQISDPRRGWSRIWSARRQRPLAFAYAKSPILPMDPRRQQRPPVDDHGRQ